MNKKVERSQWELIQEVEPEDLLKYGMIPEFIGRLPVIAPLHELSEEALVQILTQPKNALVKQYQKLFEMDGVKLKFGKGALVKVASMAALQKSGARGLRAILESALLDIMYDTPGQSRERGDHQRGRDREARLAADHVQQGTQGRRGLVLRPRDIARAPWPILADSRCYTTSFALGRASSYAR